MDQYESIRALHRVYGLSIRAISRQTGHHRKTVRKALAGLEPKYRRRKAVRYPVMGPVAEKVARWLEEDRECPIKQRHTAHRIWARLVQEEGFQGGESTVREWVRKYKASRGWGKTQAVVPLDPESAREAEADWGTAVVILAGVRRRVKMFCLRSRFSGKCFVRLYPYERQEMLFDGHMRAFAFFGGVFREIVYDNLKSAVQTILRGRGRVENRRFAAFRAHFTFRARFCNPQRGREKGGVEGLVGYARRNFLTPLPEAETLQQMNALLERRCLEDGNRAIRGREDRRTVNQRHEEERQRLLPLPGPFENAKIVEVRISRYQTAQVDRNRYSAPRAWVGCRLQAHVGCGTVSLYASGRRVAEHARLFGKSQWQLDPQHYLDLIEERPGAFEAARPIRRWRAGWPADYEVMLQALRLRLGESKGTREFVQVLRLHGRHPAQAVRRAVAQAVESQAFSAAAVGQLIEIGNRQPHRPPTLPQEAIPGVTDLAVASADLSGYENLLKGGRA